MDNYPDWIEKLALRLFIPNPDIPEDTNPAGFRSIGPYRADYVDPEHVVILQDKEAKNWLKARFQYYRNQGRSPSDARDIVYREAQDLPTNFKRLRQRSLQNYMDSKFYFRPFKRLIPFVDFLENTFPERLGGLNPTAKAVLSASRTDIGSPRETDFYLERLARRDKLREAFPAERRAMIYGRAKAWKRVVPATPEATRRYRHVPKKPPQLPTLVANSTPSGRNFLHWARNQFPKTDPITAPTRGKFGRFMAPILKAMTGAAAVALPALVGGKEKKAEVVYAGKRFPGYNQPVPSDKKDKKMMVLVNKGGRTKLIHFGQKGYSHNYSEKAKQNYLKRSAGIRGKGGKLTANDPFSANYWARKVLWPDGPADGSAKVASELEERALPAAAVGGLAYGATRAASYVPYQSYIAANQIQPTNGLLPTIDGRDIGRSAWTQFGDPNSTKELLRRASKVEGNVNYVQKDSPGWNYQRYPTPQNHAVGEIRLPPGGSFRDPAVLHELGHARFANRAIGRGIEQLRRPGTVARVGGLGAAVLADPDSTVSKASPWVVAAGTLPRGISEAAADFNSWQAANKLQLSGKSRQFLNASILSNSGHYLGRAAGAVGAAVAARQVAKALKNRRSRTALGVDGSAKLAALRLPSIRPIAQRAIRAVARPGPRYLHAQGFGGSKSTTLKNGVPAPPMQVHQEASSFMRVMQGRPVYRDPKLNVEVWRRNGKLVAAVYGNEREGLRATPAYVMQQDWGADPASFAEDAFAEAVKNVRDRTFSTAKLAAKQSTNYSCGAAALLTVLHQHGLGPSEEIDIRDLTKTTRSGTEPQGILSGAKALGLQGYIKQKTTPQDLIEAVNQGWSVILSVQSPDEKPKAWNRVWKQGHYVVLDSASEKGLTILDPSRGVPSKQNWSWESLVSRWHDFWIESVGNRKTRRIADRLAIFLRPQKEKTAQSQIATCQSKRRYTDSATAKEAAQRSEARAGFPIYTYKCPVCQGYHLTKKARSKGKAKYAATKEAMPRWVKMWPKLSAGAKEKILATLKPGEERFLKHLGMGAESVADLVLTNQGEGGRRLVRKIPRLYTEDKANVAKRLGSVAALRRKYVRLREAVGDAPEFAHMRGQRGAATYFDYAFDPNLPQLKRVPYEPPKGRIREFFGIPRIVRSLRRANRKLGRVGDLHPGNVINKRIVDFSLPGDDLFVGDPYKIVPRESGGRAFRPDFDITDEASRDLSYRLGFQGRGGSRHLPRVRNPPSSPNPNKKPRVGPEETQKTAAFMFDPLKFTGLTSASAVGGHWRTLDPSHTGHDAMGNELPGKTWVRKSNMRQDISLKSHQASFEKAVLKEKGVLALHGTGTGKTLSAIAAFEKLKDQGQAQRALVITPAGIRQNFLTKGIEKFTDSKGVILDKPKEVDPNIEYVIVSYEAFRMNPDGWVDLVKPDTIIADEVHRAANPDSGTYKALLKARGRVDRFMGLTASAVQNDPSDIVPLLQLATNSSHPLQNKTQFKRQFMKTEDSSRKSIFGKKTKQKRVINVEKLRKVLGPSIHYVEDLDATEKPAKEVEHVSVPMSKEQTKLYHMSMKGVDPKVVDKIRRGEPVSQKEALNVFTRLLRARQVSNSLSTVQEEMSLVEAAAATPKIKKILDDATEHLNRTPDGQIVMYSNFYKGGVDVLAAGLKARGIPYSVFAGTSQEGMTEKNRQKSVEDYLAGKAKVILITGAGAEGLSLGNTTMVQLADGHYNPERIAQAEARGIRAGGLAHRDPKDRKVKVKRYVSTLPKTFWQSVTFQKPWGSVDEFVYLTAKRKEDLNRDLRDALISVSQENEKQTDRWARRRGVA